MYIVSWSEHPELQLYITLTLTLPAISSCVGPDTKQLIFWHGLQKALLYKPPRLSAFNYTNAKAHAMQSSGRLVCVSHTHT